MKHAAILTAALAICACATTGGAVPRPTGTPTAGFGQVATPGALRVRPIALLEDSRCPVNVRCVWAGRLVILAEVAYRGGSEEFRGKLTLGEPLDLGKEGVTLVAAEPQKLAGTPTGLRDYRFTFEAR